jgi:tRNA pseudouridine38-40 synthase
LRLQFVRTITLLLAYDGTDFIGWQRQAVGPSVQGAVEDALARIEGSPVAVAAAGRTDAGVHAAGQVASAEVTSVLDGRTLRRALNSMLPRAIRVLQVEDRDAGFHARFSAQSKTYEYRIVTGPVVNPFCQRYAWHVPFPLDGARMGEAAGLLEGTHDFAAFRSTGTDVRTTVRRVLVSSVECISLSAPDLSPGWAPLVAVPEGMLITYRVTGTGFLRHMVRAIVGTLVQVGAGRVQPAHIQALLEGGSRNAAGPTAPAAGLCLVAVDYGDGRPAVAAHR